uniref:SAC3/GANP/THP3 conserved domain-containing protein n=1 Tax=Heliothis virescens TaxID=7102 RepID=A0A2A4JM29_HELVI
MSSYFDFFCNNLNKNCQVSQNVDCITGTCYSMCPEEEVKLRVSERLVHVLEVRGGLKKLVKSYSRSAADSNMAVPHLLRPYSVLTNTVQYLLLDITQRVDVPVSVVYDYIDDRLRAVRQDVTIQRLPPEQCVCLLEPMIRFYVFYGYQLSDLPLKDFDPVLNKKHLLECIKWYLSCCDTIDKTQGKLDQLTGFFSNLELDSEEYRLVNDQVLMESLYILCNLNDLHPLFRYIKLLKDLKRNTKLQIAYEIAIANIQGNYIKVCRLSEKLCPLSYCAFSTYLPTLQRRALEVMSQAYHSKRLAVPLASVARWLRFGSAREAGAAAAHYGLPVEGDAVRFDKTHFKADAALNKPRTVDIRRKFDLSTMDIFTYTTDK